MTLSRTRQFLASNIARRVLPWSLLLAAAMPMTGCSTLGELGNGTFIDTLIGDPLTEAVSQTEHTQPLADQISIARRLTGKRAASQQFVTPDTRQSAESTADKYAAQAAWNSYGDGPESFEQIAFAPTQSNRHPAANPDFDFPTAPGIRQVAYNTREMEIRPPGRYVDSYQDAHESTDSGADSDAENSGAVSDATAPGELQLATPYNSPQQHSIPAAMASATPIDLANALGIAGANNLDIQFARERLVAAHASYSKARVAWLPNLRMGIGFNKHDGQIQATEGEVIDSDRNSLFVGGGAGLGQAPLAGGGGGPLRLVTNLSVADTIFNRRIAAQRVGYSDQNEKAVTNQTLLDVSLAYFDLVEAYGLLANTENSLNAAQKLLTLTEDFASEGAGNQADVDRARTEQIKLKQQIVEVQRLVQTRSERLKRLLRYQTTDALAPVDLVVLPLEIYPPSSDVGQLIAEGMMTRNEIQREQYAVAANCQELRRETLRPLLPSLQLGVSGGMFGGGQSTNLDNVGGRSDLDVVAVWEAENIGLGNRFRKRETASRVRQSQQQASMIRDQIREEITVAAANVESYREQLALASEAMRSAQQSYERNFDRIQEGEGLPIELLQAIRARNESLDAYTRAVTQFNRAQFQLIRAVGRCPGA